VVVCPFSGAEAVAGVAEYDGMEAAAQVLNAKGGVLGHPVQIVKIDDGGSPTTAVSKVSAALASGAKYNVADGGCFFQDALAIAPLLARTSTPDFAPLSDTSVSPPKYPNWFVGGTLTSTPEQAVAAAMKAKGITKFAIVTGASGTLGAQELQAAAKANGMTVTSTNIVPDTAVDATAQFQAALASHPQAIAMTNYTPAIGPILSARAKLSPSIPVYGDAYVGADNLAMLTKGAGLKNIYVVTFPFLALGNAAENTPAWKTFIAADRKYDPKPLISVYADITGYDLVMAAAAGAQKAGTISGSAVDTAIGNLTSSSDVPGFVGDFSLFTPNDHAWHLTPSNYESIPAGPWSGGLIQSGN
jgi:branched-chain amino acid transport system substrate-binding protein